MVTVSQPAWRVEHHLVGLVGGLAQVEDQVRFGDKPEVAGRAVITPRERS